MQITKNKHATYHMWYHFFIKYQIIVFYKNIKNGKGLTLIRSNKNQNINVYDDGCIQIFYRIFEFYKKFETNKG